MKGLIWIFLATFFFSCSHSSRELQSVDEPNLEVVYATWMDFKNSIQFVVKSNGCTTEKSFKLRKTLFKGKYLLKLKRIKKDKCKRLPHPKVIKFDLSSYGIPKRAGLIILNKFENRPRFLIDDLDL